MFSDKLQQLIKKHTFYHDLPFKGLKQIRARRKDSKDRITKIVQMVNVRGKTIIDIGCADGALSLGMMKYGARSCLGVDSNAENIEVAKEVARYLNCRNVKFKHRKIDLAWIKQMPKVDIILYLSTWMWHVKQYGLKVAKEMLFEMSRKADVMIFDSAADDGGGRIEGATQDDIYRWVCESTVYYDIRVFDPIGEWKGGKRNIFLCKIPRFKFYSKCSGPDRVEIERISIDKIKKTFSGNYSSIRNQDLKALTMLKEFNHFPQIIKEGKDYLIMQYVGKTSTLTTDMKKQSIDILNALKKTNIIHSDIQWYNLGSLDGRLYLYDFGRARFNFTGKEFDQWHHRDRWKMHEIFELLRVQEERDGYFIKTENKNRHERGAYHKIHNRMKSLNIKDNIEKYE